MKIVDVLFVKGNSGFFFDDQHAIKKGAKHDGFYYKGSPQLSGFKNIRVSGEAVSVLLKLEDGSWANGDCCAVQYSGAGDRDPLFLADNYLPFMNKVLKPQLIGLELNAFLPLAKKFDAFESAPGKKMHTAIRYGLSQALLDAVAKAQRKIPAQIIANEYNIARPAGAYKAVPIFGQTGDERYVGSDKMILKEVSVLPHALINNIPEKLGRDGEKLIEYTTWLRKRIQKWRVSETYNPCLHIDVYGTIGTIFKNDAKKIAAYLKKLEKAAKPFDLYIEGPVDANAGRDAQVALLAEVMKAKKEAGVNVKIVADEWCNTFEDVKLFSDEACCDMVQIKTPDLGSVHNIVDSVLYCKQKGIEAYQGGTCNETDVSARICVHLALAAGAERMLAKPGMGFDEGYMIVKNEMERALAILNA
jgi:methylaspartate ammonia-lyase